MALTLVRDKEYLARDGRVWRVVCVDAPNEAYPVVAIDETGEPELFTREGKSVAQDAHQLDDDLIKLHVMAREWWIDPIRTIIYKVKPITHETVHVREVLSE